jgi:hypothetical protein
VKRIPVVLLAAAAGLARAEPYPTGEDVTQIRAVIYRQVDARCEVAAHATLSRPVRFAFLGLVVLGDEVVQEVRLTDGRGVVWLGTYALQRQQDGRWRMNGCHLAQPTRAIPA